MVKRPKQLMITGSAASSVDVEPIPMSESYHIICNKKGKILEISPSVSKLL